MKSNCCYLPHWLLSKVCLYNLTVQSNSNRISPQPNINRGVGQGKERERAGTQDRKREGGQGQRIGREREAGDKG